MILLVHILAGGLGLVAGAVALSATKGAKLHRKSGILFVYAMVTMSLTGAMIAALRGIGTNALAGLLAAYLVITALTTVRQPTVGSRWLNLGAMLVALAVGLTSVTLGFELLVSGEGSRHGVPIPMLFIFGAVGLSAGISDVRMIRSGGIRGARRLARHLWRMCFAFFFATGSFFLGQADEFPEPLRITALLVILALAPLLIMLYWLWRVRSRKTLNALAQVSSRRLGNNVTWAP
jgi:uncharacterized membrane protein